MFIHAITPKLFRNISAKNECDGPTGVSAPNLAPLDKDTVSFTGAVSCLSEHLEKQIANETPRMRRIATTYLDGLEAVVAKLRDKGFSIDRVYCEQNPVKSPGAYSSKVVRSKTFNVPDYIRATIYCNDPYDLTKTTEGLLPEMQKRGYILSEAEMSVEDLIKRGYVPTPEEALDPKNFYKKVPDLDFRLDDVGSQVTVLPEELKYSIGKPQKSGYEDIQMRFVRDYDTKRTPVQHELIILFGPNTALAKHEESEMVYGILRKFGELNMKFDDSKIGSVGFKTKRYIKMIEEMFRGKVSKKLFENAKNKDYSDIQYEIPIFFAPQDKGLFDNSFASIRKGLRLAYEDATKQAKRSPSVQKQLAKERRQDMDMLREIQDKLRKTMDYYNYENDLKQA